MRRLAGTSSNPFFSGGPQILFLAGGRRRGPRALARAHYHTHEPAIANVVVNPNAPAAAAGGGGGGVSAYLACPRTQPCQSPTDACRPRGRPALGSVRNPSQRLGMEALRTDQTRVAAIGERFGAPTHRVPCAALNRAATAWLLLASAVRRGQGFLKGTEPSDSRAFAALHAWQAICAVSEIGFCSRFLRCDRHLNLSILGTNHVVASNVGAEWGQCRRIEVLRWFCQELWRSSILED